VNTPTPGHADWQQIKALFDQVLALPPARRREFLLAVTADDAVRGEVISLLAHADAAEVEDALEPPSAEASLLESPAQAMEGQRLGPWTLTGTLLGQGGMGEVHRARRTDGAYDGEAAIKILKRGMDSAALLARFAQEQRALARLNHPHIARLFDAGLTPDHRPYFVMELVEGQAIDRAAQGLPLERRLALFLQLADAVAYAHRQLLLHRDLKPSNVLVDGQGRVKLLDFGIAKALNADDTDAATTQHGQRPFTPHYASPEQVRGEPVGTGTDIYSLGVLLYQLLTGLRPYGRDATTPQAAARSVLEEAPTKPSSLSPGLVADPQWLATRRRLVGDLDNILLKALEKPLERRYPSVDALAADIQAYLGGYPVSARPAGVAYLLSKFVARNRWAVLAGALGGIGLATGLAAALLQGRAAAALGVLGLAGGLGISLVQARQATVARDLARARFEDLRGLAHAVLFDYHNLVEPLGGSTPVRKRLVEDALTYLDRLKAGAPRDRDVRREIGMAYHTVGFVQRNGFRRPHLGDTEGALRSYERSIAILRELVDEDDSDEASAYELALALSARAGVLGQDMQLGPARLGLDEAARLFTRHMRRDTPDLRHRLELARTRLRLADVLRFHRLYEEALACVDEARHTLGSLAVLQPDHKELPHVWVWVHNIESSMARDNSDWPGVIAAEEKARALLLALHAGEPENTRFLEDLAGNAQWLMNTYGRLGEVTLVCRWCEEATSRSRRIARADPEDRSARRMYLTTLATSGWAFVEAGATELGQRKLDDLQAEVDAWTLRFNGDFNTRRQHAAFAATRAMAHAATGRAATPAAAQARSTLQALQRDFADAANATALADAVTALQAAMDHAETGTCPGTGPWLQQARQALAKLGVR
jgi:eukaryotic-like serine/threonine-protein kinase